VIKLHLLGLNLALYIRIGGRIHTREELPVGAGATVTEVPI
jgi:hypothetical protein